MSKTFYRYNAATEQYERVYPTLRQRVWASVRTYAIAIVVVAMAACALYYTIELPRERSLREHNEALASRVDLLSERTDRAVAVMEHLADRDNNFYRALMLAEPISPAQRYAGLERQHNLDRLDSLGDKSLVEDVTRKVDRLDQMVYKQIKSFDFLTKEVKNQQNRTAHTPAIQPVPAKYMRAMASGYGVRIDPIYGTRRFHEGMDFSAPVGTPVYATADGTVATASWQSQYGNLIEINHGYNYRTRYAHLSKMNVRAGQTVHRGDLIGLVGNTGKSTGPHLHYEVLLHGQHQNPVHYYFYDITPAEYDALIRLADNAAHVMD